MKRIEIGFEDMVKNIKKNKKGMLIIFLGILFGGAVCGCIDYRTYEQKPYTLEDTVVQKVSLDHLKKDETYYYQAFMELKEKSSGVNAYIQYLKQVNLSGKSMEKVSDLEEDTVEEKKKLAEVQEFYIYRKPIICDDLDAAEQFVRQKIDSNELRLDEIQKKLEERGEKAEEKDKNKKIYIEQEIEIWKDYLVKIEEPDLNELQMTNKEMDLLLEEGMESINALVERFNEVIMDIEAEEQYDVIYNRYLLWSYCDAAGIAGELDKEEALSVKLNEALIYAKSIAGLDSRKERIYAILTFSVLLGVAFSFLYGSLISYLSGKDENYR